MKGREKLLFTNKIARILLLILFILLLIFLNYFKNKIKPLLNKKTLLIIQIIVGIIFMVVTIWMVSTVFFRF